MATRLTRLNHLHKADSLGLLYSPPLVVCLLLNWMLLFSSSISASGLKGLVFFRIVAVPMVRTIREALARAEVLVKSHLYLLGTILKSHG